MTRRHNHRAQVVTSFVRRPEELEDGKVRCNGCGRVVGLTSVGRTREHRTPAGEPCAYRVVYGESPAIDELPPVNVPPQKRDGYRSLRRPTERPARSEPSRLEAGSECQDCGKWLPGERIVCGRCFNKRQAARKAAPKYSASASRHSTPEQPTATGRRTG